jgi:integrase
MIEGFHDEQDLKIFENRLKEKHELFYLIWKVGVNLALRVSDVLKITINDCNRFLEKKEYWSIDKKTKKRNAVKLNDNTLQAFKRALELRNNSKVPKENLYLFVAQGNRASNTLSPVSRQAVDKYFKEAVDDENLNINIGTHTMRKTWGRLAYNKGIRLEVIMKRLNHSSQATTLMYLGITDKEIDDVVADLNI